MQNARDNEKRARGMDLLAFLPCWERAQPRAYDFVLEQLRPGPGSRFLDIGCGGGKGAAYLVQQVPDARAVGVDISDTVLRKAQAGRAGAEPRLLCLHAPAQRLPLADGAFDAATTVMTFHHLRDAEQVVREVYRVLRPGGAFVIADVDRGHWMGPLFEGMEHLLFDRGTRARTADEYRELMEEAGFRQVRILRREGKKRSFIFWVAGEKPEGDDRPLPGRSGRIVAICRSQRRTDPKVDIGEGELRAGYGLVGDAHAGPSARQVSLLAVESIERANREHGIDAVPGSFAENLTTKGLDLLSLRVGDRLRVGPALLEVVQIGKPPEIAHTYNFQGVSILPREGVFCRVVEGGRVARGDPIQVLPREER